ncbi:hypothetical protein Tco_0143279 [Tanacetum coccineum]
MHSSPFCHNQIGVHVVNTAARCVLLVVILSAGRLVSAGRTMILLVVILSAERLVSAAGRLVSAGCTTILLVVILPDGCFGFAGSYGLCC